MFELTINNQVYPFNLGLGFLREMNKKASQPVDGVPGMKKSIGLRYSVAAVMDGDVEALIDVLNVANKGMDPRLTKAELEAYIEDDDTDIDRLFEDVLDFLKKANATKKETEILLKAVAEAEAGTK